MKRDEFKKVLRVENGSLAEEGDIRPGDSLLKVNGFNIKDYFDYKFLTTDSDVTLLMKDDSGEEYEVSFEKDEYEDLGIEFESTLMDGDRGCRNKCIFCFIDQLPKGMRETVYFKDDDTRLSFLTGNYVTLTNVDYDELDRIVRYRMSPINVSVHTTEPELRKKMLGNRFAGDIMKKLQVLRDGCITVNAQIVLCPGVNDGEYLEKTLEDLASLDNVASVSVVPVGLTKFREKLCKLRLFTSEESGRIIDFIDEFQKKMYAKTGRRFVYASDEFYLKAGRELPDYDSYDGFPQLENGVGMCRLLENETVTYVNEHRKILKELLINKYSGKKRVISLATGAAAYDIIKGLALYVSNEFRDVCEIDVRAYRIKNTFFGETVTVAGLLTGKDISEQLKEKETGDELLLTTNMMKDGENIFLDDMTADELSDKLNVKIVRVEKSGKEFAESILGVCCE